jgi:hypothetical protein
VESGVKYVKRFLRGKSFESSVHLNQALSQWIAQVADQRIHGTTHRKPIELFQKEKDLLICHSGKPAFTIQQHAIRHVARDCMVSFEANRYSVPARFVGKQVEVQCTNDRVLVFNDDKLIVSHPAARANTRLKLTKGITTAFFTVKICRLCGCLSSTPHLRMNTRYRSGTSAFMKTSFKEVPYECDTNGTYPGQS